MAPASRRLTTPVPSVAVVIPCRNEARTIAALLDALWAQQRRPDDVVVVDDRSNDNTAAAISDWVAGHVGMTVRVIAGEGRGIAAAVNAGVSATSADVIVRLDGHSAPASDYIACALETLARPGTAVVGGVWVIVPGGNSIVARAIARAVSHPLGSGGAAYRHADGKTGEIRAVETVPFGVFRRALWTSIGGFDEALLTNEDYDFNYRARSAGGHVILDGRMRSTYRARPTLGALARQYSRYGYWKARMLAKDVRSLHPRQLAAGLVLPWVVVTIVAALETDVPAVWGVAALYPFAVLLASLQIAVSARSVPVGAASAAALVTTHLCWSAGFLRGAMRLSPPRDAQS